LTPTPTSARLKDGGAKAKERSTTKSRSARGLDRPRSFRDDLYGVKADAVNWVLPSRTVGCLLSWAFVPAGLGT